MQAVINVIHNRRLHPISRFGAPGILQETGSPYHAIILARWQFSIFNLGDPNRALLLRLANPATFDSHARNNAQLRTAVELGEQLRLGQLVDLTGGSDHYFSIHIQRPDWTRRMVLRGRIGRHEFWSDPPHYFQSPQRLLAGQGDAVPPETPPEEVQFLGLGGLAAAAGAGVIR